MQYTEYGKVYTKDACKGKRCYILQNVSLTEALSALMYVFKHCARVTHFPSAFHFTQGVMIREVSRIVLNP